ncbi:hypothetical protein GCM10027299_42190 [Larkinella ripae]
MYPRNWKTTVNSHQLAIIAPDDYTESVLYTMQGVSLRVLIYLGKRLGPDGTVEAATADIAICMGCSCVMVRRGLAELRKNEMIAPVKRGHWAVNPRVLRPGFFSC